MTDHEPETVDTLRQQLAEAHERNNRLKFDLDLFAAVLGVQGRDDVDAAVIRLTAAINTANDRAAIAETKLAEAEAERDRLKVALQRFGKHEGTCAEMGVSVEMWPKCNCGLDAALLAPTQTEEK